MRSLVIDKFESLESYSKLINEVEQENASGKIYVSPLHGSSKSLYSCK